MKGINVRKLAAIATGAALLGSVIAPMVSAETVQKTDIYNDDGTPKVNIVVGSKAALSDAIWAGNLAAKIAEKAVTSKTVNISGAAGSEGSASGTIDLNGLTVDVTIGGTVSFGAGSKEYKVTMNSTSGVSEVITNNDTNVITNAQLPHLYNASKSQKVDNNNTTATITERIGLNVDAKFDQSGDVRDLVAYVESGGFYYEVVLGSSGINLGTTSFTDGSDDNVKVIFFGEEYELNTASIGGGTKNVKLVKSSAKETLVEGQDIEGLVGDHKYAGQALKVKFKQISATSATATYRATFELYDSEGNLIDTQTVDQGSNLRDVFKDSSGAEALRSNLFIETVANAATTNLGYVEVTKGTDTLLLYDTKGYPYDSTDTTGVYDYTVNITSSGNSLQRIKISNSREKWNNTNPLYPTSAGQSLTGKTGSEAVFGNKLADGTLGKDFAKVAFLGWENKEEMTSIQIGKNIAGLDSTAKGGIKFKGADDTEHVIPFALELDDSETGATLLFDTKSIWFDVNYGPSSSLSKDINVLVSSGDLVNGRTWTVSNPSGSSDGNGTITVEGIGPLKAPGSNDANVYDTNIYRIDGVNYKVMDANYSTTQVMVAVDTVLRFKKDTSSGADIYNTGGDTTDNSYGRMFADQNQVVDGNAVTLGGVPAAALGLQGNGDKKFYYAVYPATALNRLWVMLTADQLGSDESSVIQNNKKIAFVGTNFPTNSDFTEVALSNSNIDANNFSIGGGAAQVIPASSTSATARYYIPKDTDFNSAAAYSNSNAYFVANFVVNDAVSGGQFIAHIDTADGGGLGPFSNTNLSGYSTDLDYNAASPLNWSLTEGTQSNYLKSGYSDAGSKASLNDGSGVTVSVPENAQKIQIVVYGKEVTRVVTGDDVIGLKVGDTGTTSSGTKVTLKAVNGGSCKVTTVKGETGTCTADPETYLSPVAINRSLVYLDTDNPTGTNIIVGGHIVNKLASKLANTLTAPGQGRAPVVDAGNGNIYVAGYAAEDTIAAVRDLIDQIDAFEAD